MGEVMNNEVRLLEAILSEQIEANHLLREIVDRIKAPHVTLVPYTTTNSPVPMPMKTDINQPKNKKSEEQIARWNADLDREYF